MRSALHELSREAGEPRTVLGVLPRSDETTHDPGQVERSVGQGRRGDHVVGRGSQGDDRGEQAIPRPEVIIDQGVAHSDLGGQVTGGQRGQVPGLEVTLRDVEKAFPSRCLSPWAAARFIDHPRMIARRPACFTA